MKILSLAQGSADWLAHRRQAHIKNASEVGAMLGVSPLMTRTELMRAKKFGIWPEFNPEQQKALAEGHRCEALCRPRAADIIGDDLSPMVGVIELKEYAVAGQPLVLSASFDGLTMDFTPLFEHKLLNAELRAIFDDIETIAPEHRERKAGTLLPEYHRGQMEQQLLVSGAERVLFMTSQWTADGELIEERHCWYYPDLKLRERIILGWLQFDVDCIPFKDEPSPVQAVAAPVEALPAVLVNVAGALTVSSNLEKVEVALRDFIAKIPAEPETDQQFADAEAAVKVLDAFEKALAREEVRALASITKVEELRGKVERLRKLSKSTRLTATNAVDAQKKKIRNVHVQRGMDELYKHILQLNERIGKPYMPVLAAEFTDFAGAISGVKKYDSLRERINTKLTTAKIEANRIADRIQINLRFLEQKKDFAFLFPDEKALALKEQDDLQAAVSARILQHQEAQRQREHEEERQLAAAAPAPAANPPIPRNPTPIEQVTFEGGSSRSTAVVRPFARPSSAPATPQGEPTLRLGIINERLAPVMVSGDGLARLGFPYVKKDRSSLLYYEESWPAMVEAIAQYVLSKKKQDPEAA
jgi:predicted phage-related endonuclease